MCFITPVSDHEPDLQSRSCISFTDQPRTDDIGEPFVCSNASCSTAIIKCTEMTAALAEIPQQASVLLATPGIDALLTTAGFAPLANIGFIRVTGEDRVRWLNGMVTNSIVDLKLGQGAFCFFLNAQGRILGEATAWVLSDSIWLETALDRVTNLVAMLNHYIIMDDVELQAMQGMAGLLLAGPQALPALQELSGLHAEPATGLTIVEASFQDFPIQLVSAYSPLVPHLEVWATQAAVDHVAQVLEARLPQVSSADLEQLRILEGRPTYGVDIRERDLPQETGQTRALHFAKGCYLGQEIVERIRSRGNVHRTFSGFRLTGSVPPPTTSIFINGSPGKSVGEITSAAAMPLASGEVIVALGYIRREIVEQDPILYYTGGIAEPIALPYKFNLGAGSS